MWQFLSLSLGSIFLSILGASLYLNCKLFVFASEFHQPIFFARYRLGTVKIFQFVLRSSFFVKYLLEKEIVTDLFYVYKKIGGEFFFSFFHTPDLMNWWTMFYFMLVFFHYFIKQLRIVNSEFLSHSINN